MHAKQFHIAFSICILLLFSNIQNSMAQKEGNIWYFGEYAGLNFNSGSPVALGNSAMFQYDGCATISDGQGNLMFYTNGLTIWNKNHQIMDNGTGLHGGYPSSQSSIIVPKPFSDSIYYVFTIDDVAGPYGLSYSIVSMNRNSGLGSVISKNNLLLAPTTEKVTAVKHRNDSSVWVITHGWDTNAFFAYNIDSIGIKTTPVVSNVGVKHGGSLSKASGYLKASPDGKKLACAIQTYYGTVEILDFDDSTGTVSNPINITSIKDPYGIEFSPDGSKLYVSSRSFGEIFQFFLLAGSPADIKNSETKIATSSSQIGAMQVAIDAKIYVARTATYLGVIANPNAYGSSSNYSDNGVSLGGRNSKYGLPTFNQSYFFNPEFYYENQCFGDTTKFRVVNASIVDSVVWIFGDPGSANNQSSSMSPSHYYSAPGDYEIGILLYLLTGKVDTINWTLKIFDKPNADFSINDSTQCLNENAVYFINQSTIPFGELNYQWNFGDNDTSSLSNPSHHFAVEDTFNVELIAISEHGCKDTAYHKMVVHPSPNAWFTMNDSAQCFDKNKYEFKNRTTISSGTLSYHWDFGDGTATVYKNPVHTYTTADTFLVTLVATSSLNCKDTIQKNALVHVHPTPISAFSIADSFQCFDNNHFEFSNNSYLSSGTMSYIWYFDDGDSSILTEPKHNYSSSGIYDITLQVVSDWGCKARTTHKAYVNPEPRAKFSVDDSTQCLRNNTVKFTNETSIDYGVVNYNWNFGDGFNSTLRSPDHQYPVHDSFLVQLIASTPENCFDTAYGNVFIYPMPIVDFRINDNTQCLSKNSFTCTNESSLSPGTISQYIWESGDGYSYSTKDIFHKYNLDGSYDIKLACVSDFGCRDSVIKKVFVFPMPQADFSINDTEQCLNENFFQCVDSSSISSGSLTSYLWEMGDGKSYVQNSVYHSYAMDGNFNIKYKVTSNQGCEDSITKSVAIYPIPDVAFDINDNDQCLNGNNFIYQDKSSINTGSLSNRLWDVGDGKNYTLKNVVHSYATHDTFEVKLLSFSDHGCKDSLIQQVFVNPMPEADFSVNDDAQCLNGNNFSFANASSIDYGQITVNQWSFGDGTKIQMNNPTHSYATDNSYNVKLTVASQKGCQDSAFLKVYVHPMPEADFSFSNACLDENAYFTDETQINSPDNITSWTWKVDGMEFSTQNNPQYLFTSPGVYRIDLDVESNNQCTDQTHEYLKINEHVNKNLLHRVSVTEDDQILIEWSAPTEGSPSKYLIERSTDGTNFEKIAEKKVGILSHTDKQVDVATTSYTYRVRVTDSCDHLPPYTNIGKSILLKVDAEGEAPELNWTTYVDWSNGIDFQEVQLRNDMDVFNTIGSMTSTELSFIDNKTVELLDEYCYRIRAVEKNTGIESFSNVSCISVPLLVWPPNSFSPNNDGVNDYFEIKGKYITAFSIQIFDRWGEKMFESEDLNNSWDGKFKGNYCLPGVYYYRIVVTGTKEQQEVFNGSISLLR
jgi:gliding motility-associated-like protein